MDVLEALYTTRAMRRMKPDPIPAEVQAKILDAAVRAPSGGNMQNWRFMLVDDRDQRAKIGAIYHSSLGELFSTFYAPVFEAAAKDPDTPESKSVMQMRASAQHLADHFGEAPLMLFGFALQDTTGGSIFPALWSAQLAARAEGVGSTLTSVMLFHNDEVLEVLGVPAEEGWKMAACVPFGYPTGKWGVAKRRPVHEVSYRNRWGEPVGFEVPEPLWKG